MRRLENVSHKGPGETPGRQVFQRRGSLFHVTMIYLTMASSLLTLAGTVLHTILKADTSDRREAMFLMSLLRAEQQLRNDAGSGSLKVESPEILTAAMSDQTGVTWSTDRGILNRVVRQGDAKTAADRFIFPAGSQVHFQQDETGAVVVRIVEPTALVKYSAAGHGGSNRQKPVEVTNPPVNSAIAKPGVVEIVLRGVTP
ncbi:MAG: hypothetical protein U0936_18310 [Planctomycetaceae bacterium]